MYYTRILSLIRWKSFVFTNQSTKTAKLFHLDRFPLYGVTTIIIIYVCLLYTIVYVGNEGDVGNNGDEDTGGSRSNVAAIAATTSSISVLMIIVAAIVAIILLQYWFRHHSSNGK